MKYTITHKVCTTKEDFIREELENDVPFETDESEDEDDTGSGGPITWEDCPLTVKSNR